MLKMPMRLVIFLLSLPIFSADIHDAAFNGNVSVVRTYLECGGDVNAVTDHGSSLLHHASEGGSEHVVRLLLEHSVDVDMVHEATSLTALHYAAGFAKNSTIVALLMKHGANPNAQDQRGYTPLHFASSAEHKKTALALLTMADRDITDDFGRKPNLLFLDPDDYLRGAGN